MFGGDEQHMVGFIFLVYFQNVFAREFFHICAVNRDATETLFQNLVVKTARIYGDDAFVIIICLGSENHRVNVVQNNSADCVC
jgi:hypothetical protein